EHRRVPEPRGAEPARGRFPPGLERVERRQRPPRHAPPAAAEELADGRHRGAQVAKAERDRMNVPTPRPVPERRRLDALEPGAFRFFPERSHGTILAPCEPACFSRPPSPPPSSPPQTLHTPTR